MMVIDQKGGASLKQSMTLTADQNSHRRH